MEQRWKKSYRQGIANQPGPEPCEGGREAALEALDRGICRRDIELRNLRIRERTVSRQPERKNAMCDSASAARPCGVEDPRTHRNSMRENREAPSLSVVETLRAGGRRR